MNWIKTSERLPEEGQDVLICYRRDFGNGKHRNFITIGKVRTPKYITNYWPFGYYWDVPTQAMIWHVTHWMPLPELPEVEE